MPYTFDKSTVASTNYDLIQPGDYEVVIEDIAIKTVPTTGTEKISIKYRVRSDVEQKYPNRVIFEDLWKEKADPRFFNRKRLNQLMGTQHIEDGKTFNSVEELMEFLKGAQLIAMIKIEHNSYYNRDENAIAYYKSSKIQPKKLGEEEEPKRELTDEELPF
jgi:hypothetical protein